MTSPDVTLPTTEVAATPSAASTKQTVAQVAAPLVTLAATWAVRRAMASGYGAITGRPAPKVESRESSLLAKVAWAAAVAGVIALVEVAVWHVMGDDES